MLVVVRKLMISIKKFFYLFFMIAAILTLSACSDNSIPENNSDDNSAEAAYISSYAEKETSSEKDDDDNDEKTTNDLSENEEEELKIIGTESEKTFGIKMNNYLGKTIIGINIARTTESFSEENMLNMNNVQIYDGESALIYFENTSEEDQYEESDTEYAISVRYKLLITTDNSEEYILNVFPIDDMQEFDLLECDNEENQKFAFIEYISSASGEEVSTEYAESANNA